MIRGHGGEDEQEMGITSGWLRVLFQGMTSGDSQAEKKTDKKSLCVVAVAVGHHCTSSPVTSVHAAKSLAVAPDKALTC